MWFGFDYYGLRDRKTKNPMNKKQYIIIIVERQIEILGFFKEHKVFHKIMGQMVKKRGEDPRVNI